MSGKARTMASCIMTHTSVICVYMCCSPYRSLTRIYTQGLIGWTEIVSGKARTIASCAMTYISFICVKTCCSPYTSFTCIHTQGLIGWTGIVPAKARTMAARMVQMVTKSLINVTQVASRVEPHRIVEIFQPLIPFALEKAAKEGVILLHVYVYIYKYKCMYIYIYI